MVVAVCPVRHELRHWPPGTDLKNPCRLFCGECPSTKLLHPSFFTPGLPQAFSPTLRLAPWIPLNFFPPRSPEGLHPIYNQHVALPNTGEPRRHCDDQG